MKKDKLYKVNKFNRPAFMKEENLFVGGGTADTSSHAYDFGNGYSSPGSTTQMRRNSYYLKGLDQQAFDTPLEKGLNIGVGNLADASAKTINQEDNKVAVDPNFTQANGSSAIVTPANNSKSDVADVVQKIASAIPLSKIANNTAAVLGTTNLVKGAIANTVSNAAKPTIQAAAQAGLQGTALDLVTQRALQDAVSNTAIKSAGTTAGTTASAAANASKFSQALGASKLGSVGSAGVGIAGSLIGMGANKLISEGYDTTAGNMVSDIGGTIGGVVGYFNPVIGAIISAATGAIGGVVNRGFGMKTDYQALANLKNAVAQNNALATGVTSYDDIQGPVSASTDVYEGGWFRGGDEDEKEAQLREELNFSQRNIENALENIGKNRQSDLFRHSYGFGGPLEMINDDNMSAIDYNFLDRLLTTKENKQAQNSNMTNLFAGTSNGIYAIGGDLQALGSDWSTGLSHINAGGSHEMNPNDGVQMGVDSEGTPNLVEEGEVVFNDYVYSNRINVDQTTKEKFHLPKKKDITYADLAKKLEKEISERPNDPLSQAGFKAQMEQLEEQQERQKQEMEAERAKAAFEALSPEEQTALMQRAAQEEQMAQQAIQQEAIAAQQQPTPEEIAMAQQAQMQADGSQAMVDQEPQFAEGGHLYPWGGIKEMFAVDPPYAASKTAGYIPYIQNEGDKFFKEDAVKARELEDDFKAWTDYVNGYWDNPNLDDVSRKQIEDYLRLLDATAGGNHLFDKEGKMVEKAKEYFNHARTKNHKWGYYHLTPTQQKEIVEELKEVNPDVPLPSKRKEPSGTMTTDATGVKPDDSAVRTAATTPVSPAQVSPEEKKDIEQKKIVPDLKKESYLGLFGPALGLGFMAANVDKPDESGIKAAIDAANQPAHLAGVDYIGDYMSYRPFDRLFYANQLNGQSLATARMLMNTNSPSRAANLLAHAYNTMLANGQLFRQGEEYDRAQYEKTKDFNRGTNIFNAQAYNQNQQFNAEALNRAKQYSASLGLQGAAQKMDADQWWASNLYGNLGSLFDNIGQWEEWKRNHNTVAKMYANGLAGTVTPNTPVASGFVTNAACGGKMKKKKRGLTF